VDVCTISKKKVKNKSLNEIINRGYYATITPNKRLVKNTVAAQQASGLKIAVYCAKYIHLQTFYARRS
jgi:hypothetical protein